MTFDVCVVGGAGHVGAPLAIVFADRGMRTLVLDKNEAAMSELRSGRLPFLEEGGEPPLRRALAAGCLDTTADPSRVRGVPILVITIGTPVDEFQNPRVDVIRRCVDELMPYLSSEQAIVLRSTVSPGVTEYLHQYLRRHGLETGVAFCPERVVQGKAILEIGSLAQIVSGTTPEAEEKAAALFARVAPRIVRMSPREAEYAKLISNAYRYITFAAANQFYMMVQGAGLDYARVAAGLKEEYPRMRDLPGPGFAAGPCLMKDTVQLMAFDQLSFPLGRAAVTINEGLPNFIVEEIARRRDLEKTRVGILGMAFKADIDDTRESLSYKLGKILRFRGATVLYSDEYAKDPTFVPKEELVRGSDVVVVGVPHRAYRTLRIPDGVDTIDLWGALPRG
ncbi:MAG TPA: nucleotide sugar dehydrogenase [Candidatus Limnocylindria bacterium]|nr:nucleotide sugar dehydrogenase [Candidatus Limnocylindria bacterium]